MTYKDINGLENYEDMYRAFQDYEDESARYEESAREGNADLYLLRKAIREFRTIIETIIIEFSKKYPMCEVKDGKGIRSIPDTLKMLKDEGYIDGRTRGLLSSINYFGSVGSHPEKPLNTSDYQEISSRYQELLYYMPSFLNQFPKPGDAGNSGQIRYCRNCGSPISANAKYCSKCGAPVSNSGHEDSSKGSNYDDQYTYTDSYEEGNQSGKHRNHGIRITVLVIALLAVIAIMVVLGISQQFGGNSGSSESSVAEKASVSPEEFLSNAIDTYLVKDYDLDAFWEDCVSDQAKDTYMTKEEFIQEFDIASYGGEYKGFEASPAVEAGDGIYRVAGILTYQATPSGEQSDSYTFYVIYENGDYKYLPYGVEGVTTYNQTYDYEYAGAGFDIPVSLTLSDIQVLWCVDDTKVRVKITNKASDSYQVDHLYVADISGEGTTCPFDQHYEIAPSESLNLMGTYSKMGYAIGQIELFDSIAFMTMAPADFYLSQDDASTVEIVGETAASVSDKEQPEGTASNNDDGTKTHSFTAISSNDKVTLTDGTVIYNDDGSALVAFNVDNSSSNNLNFGWDDEDFQIELQLANGKTCSATLTESIIYAGGTNFFMFSFNDVNANIDQITIYPVYTLSSRGIPENIDNGDTYTFTVHKES